MNRDRLVSDSNASVASELEDSVPETAGYETPTFSEVCTTLDHIEGTSPICLSSHMNETTRMPQITLVYLRVKAM